MMTKYFMVTISYTHFTFKNIRENVAQRSLCWATTHTCSVDKNKLSFSLRWACCKQMKLREKIHFKNMTFSSVMYAKLFTNWISLCSEFVQQTLSNISVCFFFHQIFWSFEVMRFRFSYWVWISVTGLDVNFNWFHIKMRCTRGICIAITIIVLILISALAGRLYPNKWGYVFF